MSNICLQEDLTPSICEEALDQFSNSDDSLAQVIEGNSIEVRDFMVLSFVCDQSKLDVEQLTRVLGLSQNTILDCIARLNKAALVLVSAEPSEDLHKLKGSEISVSPTAAGRTIARRVLGAG